MLDVLFAGSPECAVPALEAVARSHRIVAILTNPPAPAGRHGSPVPTPVALAAERLRQEGLIPEDTPILTPEKITQEVRDAIAGRKPEVLACFAYGKIFGPKTLALFPRGGLNLHPSLLPRWRGCAPVPAAILARDRETGISIQRISLGMDEGDIVIQTRFPLDGTETAESLLAQVAHDGAPLLVDALNRLEAGTDTARAQDSGLATYSPMLRKEDGEIRWTDSAADIDARIRAFSPWPGAFTRTADSVLLILQARPYTGTFPPAAPDGSTGDAARDTSGNATVEPGTVVGVDKKEGILVQTGNGLLVLEKLQWKTKKALDWKSFLNGSRDFPGTVLGQAEKK
jgi:methionyl-tRNA formyltransferase